VSARNSHFIQSFLLLTLLAQVVENVSVHKALISIKCIVMWRTSVTWNRHQVDVFKEWHLGEGEVVPSCFRTNWRATWRDVEARIPRVGSHPAAVATADW